MKKKMLQLLSYLLLFSCLFVLPGCSNSSNSAINSSAQLDNMEAYHGEPYTVINDNVPVFTAEDLVTDSYEHYSELDHLGRCGVAMANVGTDLMPTEERGSIGQVKPTGWQTVKYDIVDGKYLYNRCHLIGYQLTGENANKQNLITGTRYLNVDGMLPFENMVADYVKETNQHVLYRVTPIFTGDNLVADGVQMEAMSVEDKGDSICFNVFVYNVQPGITIDYATGESKLAEEGGAIRPANTKEIEKGEATGPASTQITEEDGIVEPASAQTTVEIRGNSNSKIYHCPGQANYETMADSKNLVTFSSEEEAQAAGYRKAKN